MPTPKRHALTILGAFEEARSELVGKTVILTDGKAGTVENVWLDCTASRSGGTSESGLSQQSSSRSPGLSPDVATGSHENFEFREDKSAA